VDYGIGMFLAGLVSGAGLGWYTGIYTCASDKPTLRRVKGSRLSIVTFWGRLAYLRKRTRPDNLACA